jgi:hypothetical protein
MFVCVYMCAGLGAEVRTFVSDSLSSSLFALSPHHRLAGWYTSKDFVPLHIHFWFRLTNACPDIVAEHLLPAMEAAIAPLVESKAAGANSTASSSSSTASAMGDSEAAGGSTSSASTSTAESAMEQVVSQVRALLTSLPANIPAPAIAAGLMKAIATGRITLANGITLPLLAAALRADLERTLGVANAHAVAAALSLAGGPSQRPLAHASFVNLSSSGLEVQLTHVMAAEALAGFGRWLMMQPPSRQAALWPRFEKLLHSALDVSGLDSLDAWCAAIRAMCARLDPRRTSSILTYLLRRLLSIPSADTAGFSVEAVKAVRGLTAILMEQGHKLQLLHQHHGDDGFWLALKHLALNPTPMVRKELGHMVSVLLMIGRPRWEGSAEFSLSKQYPRLSGFVDSLSSALTSDSAEKTASHEVVELAVIALSAAVQVCDVLLLEHVVLALVPKLFLHVHHPHVETAKNVEACLAGIAGIHLPPVLLSRLINEVLQALGHASFHIRIAAVKHLTSMLSKHNFVLGEMRPGVMTAMLPLLQDPQLEVAQRVATMLISCWCVLVPPRLPTGEFFRYGNRPLTAEEREEIDRAATDMDAAALSFDCPAYPEAVLAQSTAAQQYHDKLVKQLKKWANSKETAPPPSSSSSITTSASSTVSVPRQVLAGVLGLGAVIKSEPYDIPNWLPPIATWLAKFTSSAKHPLALATCLKNIFAEFKRTHQDRWEELRLCFTEDQLQALRDIETAPSYIV